MSEVRKVGRTQIFKKVKQIRISWRVRKWSGEVEEYWEGKRYLSASLLWQGTSKINVLQYGAFL